MTKPTKKALLILKFVDEEIFILEPIDRHVPKRQYKEEAVSFLDRLLKRKPPKVPCFKAEAAQKLRDIVGFHDPDLIQDFPEFKNGGVEWHPIVFCLDMYMLSKDFTSYLRKDAARHLKRLQGHPFEQNVRKSLGLKV